MAKRKSADFIGLSFNQVLIAGFCFFIVLIAFLYSSIYSPTSKAAGSTNNLKYGLDYYPAGD